MPPEQNVAGSTGGAGAADGSAPLTAEQQIAAAVTAALSATLPQQMNAAIEANNKKMEARFKATYGEKAPVAPTGDATPTKPDEKVAAMERSLATMQKQLADADAKQKTMEREGHLRQIVSGLGVVDVESTMRILMPDLKVGEDNRLWRDDPTRGLVPLEEYAKSFVASNKWLLAATGRQGGGGTGSATVYGGAQSSMTAAEYAAKLATFGADGNKRVEFVQRVLRGEVQIKG